MFLEKKQGKLTQWWFNVGRTSQTSSQHVVFAELGYPWHSYTPITFITPFNAKILIWIFTWSCVSLTRPTTSDKWKLFRFDQMEVNEKQTKKLYSALAVKGMYLLSKCSLSCPCIVRSKKTRSATNANCSVYTRGNDNKGTAIHCMSFHVGRTIHLNLFSKESNCRVGQTRSIVGQYCRS